MSFIFLVVGMLSSKGYSQIAQGSNIIPPSPNAASLGQYADIPVGYYTGVANISMPLYTIQSGKIELPVSLRYHASGIKVAQEASVVGLGWSLNAGGVITRQVRGLDDFSVNGYINADALPPTVGNTNLPDWSDPNNTKPNEDNFNNHYRYFKNIEEGNIDGEPDIFYYNFFGFSGKLFFEKQKGNVVRAISHEQNNLDILYHKDSQRWEITDGNGLKYFFGKTEKTDNYTLTSTSPITLNILEDDTEQDDVITSWFIDKAESPDGDEINFLYNASRFSIGQVYYSELRQRIISLVQNHVSGNGFISPAFSNNVLYSASMQEVNDVYLEKIIFNNGYIKFILEDRDDIRPRSTLELKPQRVKSMEVYNSGDVSIKNIDFKYYYRSSRLMLEEIQESFKDRNKADIRVKPPYVFKYNQTHLPEKNSYSVDHWGYFNGAGNNSIRDVDIPQIDISQYIDSHYVLEIDENAVPQGAGPKYTSTLVPLFEDRDGPIVFLNGANREPDGSKAKAAILESITYPTGGITRFEYESHDYSSETDQLYEPGYTEAYTSYDYGEIPSGMEGVQEQRFTLEEGAFVNLTFSMYNHTYTPDDDGLILLYEYTDVLLEKIHDDVATKDELVKLKLIENMQSFDATMAFWLPPGNYRVFASSGQKDHLQLSATISYRNQAPSNKKQGGGLRIKSIEHYVKEGSNFAKKTSISYEENGFSTGRMMSPFQYFYNETLIQNATNILPGNIINFIYTAEFIVSSSESVIPLGTSAQGSFIGYDKVIVKEEGAGGENIGLIKYHYENKEEISGGSFMPGVPNSTNLGNGRLVKEEYYNDDNVLVREKILKYKQYVPSKINIKAVKLYSFYGSSQDGKEVRYYDTPSEWWYPESTTETVYDTDGSNPLTVTTKYSFQSPVHKLATSITQQTSDGETLVTKTFYPDDITSATSLEGGELSEEEFNAIYNLKAYHRISVPIQQETWKNGVKLSTFRTSYKMWYNNNQSLQPEMVKFAKGNDPLQIQFQYHSYDYDANPIMISKEDGPITSYFWGYKGLSIAKVENATQVEIAEALGTSIYALKSYSEDNLPEINSLREKLPKAMVTTYTYAPLIGMTSMTDPNGITSFYEYDAFGRLKVLKDHEGNVLQTYEYNYAVKP